MHILLTECLDIELLKIVYIYTLPPQKRSSTVLHFFFENVFMSTFFNKVLFCAVPL